jgi:hypothetical protein
VLEEAVRRAGSTETEQFTTPGKSGAKRVVA